MAEQDLGYKRLFAQREMVADLLTGFVREPWVNEVQLDTLERVSGSDVSDDLRAREDDIVWRVRWRGQWLYVYLLLEFQASVDRFMAFSCWLTRMFNGSRVFWLVRLPSRIYRRRSIMSDVRGIRRGKTGVWTGGYVMLSKGECYVLQSCQKALP